MANQEQGTWVTINGRHVFIREGESATDAVNRSIAEHNAELKKKQIERNKSDADKISGKKKSYKANDVGSMTPEERKKFLDDAVEGTVIKGLYDKRTGNELVVSKEFGYYEQPGSLSSKFKGEPTGRWYVGGSYDPYISRTLRQAADGTSKYYMIKKK